MASGQSAATSQPQQQSAPEEFVIRVPVTSEKKKYSILKFSNNLGVDVTQWKDISLSHEDNTPIYTGQSNDPKFGAGSEYGKQQREEARRKKLGFRSRRYRIDDQPWNLTLPGKQERKFRGQKEGGVNDHADYWIFVKAGEGIFDAYPVSNWYNFTPVARYKTLDADEAEEQFKMRHKVMNQFAFKSLLKSEGGDEDSKDSVKGRDGNSKKKAAADEDEFADVGPTKGVGKGKKKPPKKRKENFDEDDPMASEDSDDGDDEGREMDYISSTDTEEEEEPEELVRNDRGVDEEAGMRTLIASEDEEELVEEGQKEGEDQKPDPTKAETVTTTGFEDAEENESDSGSESDDPDKEDIKSALFLMQRQKTDAAPTPTTAASAGPSAPDTSSKRKLPESADQPPHKKHKTDKDKKSEKPASLEDEVRRYLERRAMSTTELVSKMKKYCKSMAKQEIVQKLADILKRLKPEQERRNGVLYFWLQKD